jgi:ribosome-associated toxin RatA of RatAB toxin-antitoxin module
VPARVSADADSRESRSDGLALSNEITPDGQTAVQAVFDVDADADAVYRVLRDAERFPEFMPDTKEVRILESGPGYQITHFWGGKGVFESRLTLKRTLLDTDRKISWSLIEGRPRAVTGYWHVEQAPDGRGSRVTYLNHIDVGGWIPEAMVRHFVKQSLHAMAANLRKRVDSGGVWQSAEYLERTRRDAHLQLD